jgi:hypothetical protein
MSDYRHARAYLDPLGLICSGDGSYRQQIELALANDPDRDPPSLADPVCTLDAAGARALARRLLVLAEHAENPHAHTAARR